MLAKMETAKAVVEVYSPRAGTVESLHGKPGETIKVGAPLVSYKSEAGEPQAPSPPDNGKTSESSSPDESLVASVDDAFDINGLDDDREDAGTVVGMLGDTEPTLPGGE